MSDRHAFRAKWHDYNDGIYFVTVCSQEKQHLFGSIYNGTMHFAPLGRIIEENIKTIPTHYDDVELWNHVVMPNHIHMVLAVGTRFIASAPSASSAPSPSSTPSPSSPSNFGCLKPPRHGVDVEYKHHNSRLASIIGAFKAGVSRTARTRKIASLPCWQTRFHEHIIRNQRALDNIMDYIDNNIVNWNNDCLYLNGTEQDK